MRINELIGSFGIWTTNEELAILKRLQRPVLLHTLSEQDQFKIEALVRKSLVTKIGQTNPKVVANEEYKAKD